MRRPGIKDVAAHSGVSIKTVSRVVNGESAVRPETERRVLDAIQFLGYVPNTAARSLKSGTGGAIGIVIDSLADPFFASLVSAIEARALTEGLSVLVASTGLDADRERQQILSLVAGHQVAGIILAPVAEELPYLEPFRNVTPVVAVDRASAAFDSIVVDDYGATSVAIRQLVDLGHRRIAFYDRDERFTTILRRYRAYTDVLEAEGLAIDPELVSSTIGGALDYPEETARLFGLLDPPTAFFVSNAKAAIGLMSSLAHIGRQNTAVIAFGDFSLAGALRPAISCIDQDPTLIGNAAIERLLELRASPGAEPREWVVPTTLVRRGSGEIPGPAHSTVLAPASTLLTGQAS